MLGFHKYERCILFSLPSIKNWRIELVYAPRGYEIKPHTHPNEDIKLIFLFGHDVTFSRKRYMEIEELYKASFRNIGRMFTINSGDIHYFKVSKWPLIFMNIEKWKDGVRPSSAAKDLQEII